MKSGEELFLEKLIQERVVLFGYLIDDTAAREIISQLLFLDNVDESEISVYINSPGGEMIPSMAIYDVIKTIKSDIVTVCLREAIGTAVLLVASGTKGNRCALPHARFKFVPLEISDEILSLTDSEEIIHYQAEFENVRQTFIRALSDATGQSTDKIVRDMEKRLSLTAQEAVEYGLIDQILQRDAD